MLISFIKKQLLTNWIANHLVGVITFDFTFLSDGYICRKFACNLQSIVPKQNGITTFEIVLAKPSVGTYNSAVEIHWSVMCLREKYFQLVSHYTSQFFEEREENIETAIEFFVLDFRQ